MARLPAEDAENPLFARRRSYPPAKHSQNSKGAELKWYSARRSCRSWRWREIGYRRRRSPTDAFRTAESDGIGPFKALAQSVGRSSWPRGERPPPGGGNFVPGTGWP